MGARGQARLESASATVREEGLAAEIEERYLRGAGVPSLTRDGRSTGAPYEIEHTSAALVARGARSALETIRRILG